MNTDCTFGWHYNIKTPVFYCVVHGVGYLTLLSACNVFKAMIVTDTPIKATH